MIVWNRLRGSNICAVGVLAAEDWRNCMEEIIVKIFLVMRWWEERENNKQRPNKNKQVSKI